MLCLVGLRIKGLGMHWSPLGATAVTALRTHNLVDNWYTRWNSLMIPKYTSNI